jgi:hypothetical protein
MIHCDDFISNEIDLPSNKRRCGGRILKSLSGAQKLRKRSKRLQNNLRFATFSFLK